VISLIGGLANSSSVPRGTMDLHPLFMIIRFILAIIFAYFGWRPQNKNDKNEVD
jgi:preprotein translocase subunit YajC